MKAGGPIVRRTPLRAKGGRRFKEGNDPPFLRFLAGPGKCVVAMERPEFEGECDGPNDPAHIEGRAHTGVDRRNAVRMCRFHHNRQSAPGWGIVRWCATYMSVERLKFWAEAFAEVYERREKITRGEVVPDLPF